MAEKQDVIVIGAGSGGFAAAMRALQLGGKVTLIEGDRYGGNCMNTACIPSKVLLSAARLVSALGTAQSRGILLGERHVDLEALHERKDLIVESLRMGTEQLLIERGVRLLEGWGRLAAPDAVEVNGELIRARNIILATGSVAAQQPIEGTDLPGVIGTEEAMELRDIPSSIAILGSLPWDVELAQYFHALGSQVTVIEGGRQLLPGADRELAQRLGKLYHDAGIAIQRNSAAEAIRQTDDGALEVVLSGGKGEVPAAVVLAARRLPKSTGLGLPELGVRMRHGAVLVDEQMRTNVPSIFAVGDLAQPAVRSAGSMWSHKANAEGIAAAERAMGSSARMDYGSVPHCLYTWPEVAWVGLTEGQAKEAGVEYEVGKFPWAASGRALGIGRPEGVTKLLFDPATHRIIGAGIVGPHAGDLIAECALAIEMGAEAADIGLTIHPHPTLSESIAMAAEVFEGTITDLYLPKKKGR